MRMVRQVLRAAGFLLVFVSAAYAQGTGQIFGKVTDYVGRRDCPA